jgi:single-stranded-DNA-specific exonuclease
MKNWRIKHTYQKGQSINHENFLKQLLANRGIDNELAVANFLNPPKVSYWIDKFPSDFKDSLVAARKLVTSAIADNNPIVIHGDYDSDGVSATAILYQTIADELGYANAHFFIPNRFRHGYGLSMKSLSELYEKYGPGLLITVDSGITSVDEVAKAKTLGYKVIITDHHQKPDPLPASDVTVWSDAVVGSSVSWVLSRVLGSKDPTTIAYSGLATVTDLYPVVNFNRTILKAALEVLNTNPPMGLKKMFEIAGRNRGRITAYDLGWVIGPRLNASGRLVEAEDSLRLLLAKDEQQALDLAMKLNTVNVTRQDKTLEMFELASDFDATNLPKIIFSAKEDYHEGIIGLVAAKLVQKYYRPAIVVSIFDGHAKGSVRSIEGVNIIEALREFEHLFESLGGHPMAAGFSLEANKLPELQKALEVLGDRHVHDEHLVRNLNIDMEIPIDMVDLDLYKTVTVMEPFGLGNEEPIFATKNLPVAAVDKVGRDAQHLSFKFYKDGKTYKGIWFNAADHLDEFRTGDIVDVAFTLNYNEFNGRINIDLLVKDMKKSVDV